MVTESASVGARDPDARSDGETAGPLGDRPLPFGRTSSMEKSWPRPSAVRRGWRWRRGFLGGSRRRSRRRGCRIWEERGCGHCCGSLRVAAKIPEAAEFARAGTGTGNGDEAEEGNKKGKGAEYD